jgi:processive 1,2-diacylglycerol beta-glucosyltransferase
LASPADGTDRRPAPRVLVLTAAVGAGHDVPARAIAASVRARRPDAEVEIADVLDAMGPLVHRVAEDDMRRTFGAGRMNWVFDAQYLLFARSPLRVAGQTALHRYSGPRLERVISGGAPDVVVSTYPAATDVLGFLRRRGRLGVPAVGVITDLAGLHYWASPGVDLHLVTHPESIPEVQRVAGRHAEVAAVRGLHDERFLDPPCEEGARRSLGLPAGPVIAVSGGGWGVGDVEGAARIALETPGATVLALAGRNDLLLERLRTVPAGRLRAVPFVDDLVTLLAASDVLVHSTAGLTILEALLVGCRPVSYGWSVGHVRVNERAFRRAGLARVARNRDELRTAIAAALTDERRPRAPAYARLPHAADRILALVA